MCARDERRHVRHGVCDHRSRISSKASFALSGVLLTSSNAGVVRDVSRRGVEAILSASPIVSRTSRVRTRSRGARGRQLRRRLAQSCSRPRFRTSKWANGLPGGDERSIQPGDKTRETGLQHADAAEGAQSRQVRAQVEASAAWERSAHVRCHSKSNDTTAANDFIPMNSTSRIRHAAGFPFVQPGPRVQPHETDGREAHLRRLRAVPRRWVAARVDRRRALRDAVAESETPAGLGNLHLNRRLARESPGRQASFPRLTS